MPEVVEVCLTSLFLNHKLKNKQITKIDILGGRYSRHSLKGLTYFKPKLPVTINKVRSKGKFMWFEMMDQNNNDFYILNRFGLSGEWGFEKKDHSGVMLEIDDDKKKKTYRLYFTDPRNFGTIEITSKKSDLDNELNKLGDDFLQTSFTNNDFYKRIEDNILNSDDTINASRANKEIIKVLMDQTLSTGLGSGLGNYLGVEVLYDAGISPHKKLGDIYKDKKLANKLAESIKYVVKLSYVTAEVGYLSHLDNRLKKWVNKLRTKIKNNKKHKYHFHPDSDLKNDKFEFKVYRQKTDPLGNKVKADKIITGRTTYWVPSIQK